MSPFASFDAGPRLRGFATLRVAVATLELLADRRWHTDYGRGLADAFGPRLLPLAVDGTVASVWDALHARGLVARRDGHALRVTPLGLAALGVWRARYVIAAASLAAAGLATLSSPIRGRSAPRSSRSRPTQ